MGIWANEFTSLYPLNTTEELAWITVTFLPNSRFPKCGHFKAERSPESLWNDLGGPFLALDSANDSSFFPRMPLRCPSWPSKFTIPQRGHGRGLENWQRAQLTPEKGGNYYHRKVALHTAPSVPTGFGKKGPEKQNKTLMIIVQKFKNWKTLSGILRTEEVGDSSSCSPLKVKVAQSCPTLCDPMDCSPSGSFVHGILQARILEWVVISFSRGSYRSRDRTQVSCTAGRFFTIWAAWEAP